MRYVDKETRERVEKEIQCEVCGGSGLYDYSIGYNYGINGPTSYGPCWNCNGTGVKG